MDVILCFFHWIPKGAVRSWRSLPRCSDRRAVRGGLRSSPCPSVFSSPPRLRGVPRRWWPVLSFCVCFHGSCVLFLFCSFSSWRHHEVTPPDAITRWHRLTPLRDDTAATSKNHYNLFSMAADGAILLLNPHAARQTARVPLQDFTNVSITIIIILIIDIIFNTI